MALVDLEGHCLQVNDALCRITGHSRAAFKATTLRALTHPEDVDLDADSLRALLDGGIPSYQVEKRYRHAWGHYLWGLLTVSLVRDDQGNILYVVSQVQDISERRELAQRLEYLIDHDFLTGLANRRRFEQELSREAERVARYGAPGAVLLIDLDNFKEVNDAFGHMAGDDLLKGVAGAVKHRIRQTDLLARIGGDEFGVLLPQADADQAQIAADGIVKALGRHVAVLGDQSIRVTASVGLAMFDRLSAAEVLACADVAMYEAKEAGRNRFALYSPAAEAGSRLGAAGRGGASPHGARGRSLRPLRSTDPRPAGERGPPVRGPAAPPGRRGRRAAHPQHLPVRRRALRADPGHRRLGRVARRST